MKKFEADKKRTDPDCIVRMVHEKSGRAYEIPWKKGETFRDAVRRFGLPVLASFDDEIT